MPSSPSSGGLQLAPVDERSLAGPRGLLVGGTPPCTPPPGTPAAHGPQDRAVLRQPDALFPPFCFRKTLTVVSRGSHFWGVSPFRVRGTRCGPGVWCVCVCVCVCVSCLERVVLGGEGGGRRGARWVRCAEGRGRRPSRSGSLCVDSELRVPAHRWLTSALGVSRPPSTVTSQREDRKSVV